MGGAFSAGTNNDELVDNLVEDEFIRTPLVEQVFRSVDRGNYYWPSQRDYAYEDIAWSMGHLQLSAPRVYSVVMEALTLKPGLSFLNLGSGSGYFSTMAGLILGPYGINHGIELYKEIVDFAYERLNDFIGNANAIDEYDFCEPSFFVGNCLLLDNSCQQYDRVYCGASCPADYEIYIKNLVKVGGILVMPLNKKLLKMTRISESIWTTTDLLSLSVPALITPPSLTEHEHAKFIKVGNFCPPKLTYLCRYNIRAVLRKNIHKDYPNLKNKQRQVELNHKKNSQRTVFPLFDEHDLNDSNSNSDFESDSDSPGFTISTRIPSTKFSLKKFIHGHLNSQASNEASQMQSHSSSIDNHSKENWREDPNNKANSESKGHSKRKTKPKKIRKSKLIYIGSINKDTLPPSSKILTSDERRLIKQLTLTNKCYLRTQVYYRKTSENQAVKKRKLSRKQSALDDRGKLISVRKIKSASLLCEQKTRNSDSEMEEDSKSDNIPKEENIEDDSLTNHMIKRIAALPLPAFLIRYINNFRNNL